MADRIITMRALLKKNLEELGSKQDWGHITSQVRFAWHGLTQKLIANLHCRLVCLLTLA